MANSDKKQLILKTGEDFRLKREVRLTDDGSTTIFVPSLNENYHSTFGAMQESMHVFIESGLKQNNLQQIKIFEVGFGTGLNCLLTYVNSNKKQILYHSIERFPVEIELLNQLNYNEFIDNENIDFYNSVHQLKWNFEKEIVEGFVLKKIEGDITQYNSAISYNLIYFDAFAPEVQPELWTPEIFQKMFEILDPGGNSCYLLCQRRCQAQHESLWF